MSYKLGLAAMNLEMSERVPRTEYYADNHWELVSVVTGIDVCQASRPEIKKHASEQFRKAWDYSFVWSTLVHSERLPGRKTSMGHSVYAQGGGDYNDNKSCPFSEPEEALSFDPFDEYGEVDEKKATGDFNAHIESNRLATPDAVNTTGIYITCVSGLIEIFGWEMLLLAAGTDPRRFGDLTDRYVSWVSGYFNALAQSDSEFVMIHDDIVWTEGAIFHPDWYRRYVFPNYKKLFEPVIESGKKIIFTSDGNYTGFIDDIAACGVHGFVMEPLTDMGLIAEKYGKTHVFIGNADTRVLLMGTKQDIYGEVKRCMDIGKRYPGFIMAVGNQIPPNTPVSSALYYNEAYEKLSGR